MRTKETSVVNLFSLHFIITTCVTERIVELNSALEEGERVRRKGDTRMVDLNPSASSPRIFKEETCSWTCPWRRNPLQTSRIS
jgi:hypothetical protein